MNCEMIEPGIFKGLPVKAFFTTKAFPYEEGLLKTQLRVEAVYFPIQKHTDKVLVIEYDLEPRIADAVVTNRKGLASTTRSQCRFAALREAGARRPVSLRRSWNEHAGRIRASKPGFLI